MQIFTIGGGEITDQETLPIDREIVQATGRRKPQALFVPTASGDALGYCRNFETLYGNTLGCSVESLLLCDGTLPGDVARRKILEADLIYVGGGNTLNLMAVWERYGLETWLREAAARGTVMAGLSAGAICWHERGFSDADRFSEKGEWAFRTVHGLGWLPGMYCPHLDAERRLEPLIRHVIDSEERVLACDNGAALHWKNGGATVLSSLPEACAYDIRSKQGEVCISRLPAGARVHPG